MPPHETLNRHDYAVYWEFNGTYDVYGNQKYDAPVELSVRWEHCRKEMQTADGEPIWVDAVIATDRNLVVGSRMWQGRLTEYPTGTGTGLEFASVEDELMHVVLYEQAEDIKGRHTRREAGLKFLHHQGVRG